MTQSITQLLNEEELKKKLSAERQRLKDRGFIWDVADVMAIVRPYLRKS
jgi:hypothetical protein